MGSADKYSRNKSDMSFFNLFSSIQMDNFYLTDLLIVIHSLNPLYLKKTMYRELLFNLIISEF